MRQRLTSSAWRGAVRIVVRDEGIGFDPAACRRTASASRAFASAADCSAPSRRSSPLPARERRSHAAAADPAGRRRLTRAPAPDQAAFRRPSSERPRRRRPAAPAAGSVRLEHRRLLRHREPVTQRLGERRAEILVTAPRAHVVDRVGQPEHDRLPHALANPLEKAHRQSLPEPPSPPPRVHAICGATVFRPPRDRIGDSAAGLHAAAAACRTRFLGRMCRPGRTADRPTQTRHMSSLRICPAACRSTSARIRRPSVGRPRGRPGEHLLQPLEAVAAAARDRGPR